MVREIKPENLDDFEDLLQQYIGHVDDPFLSVEELKEQLQSGITSGSRYVLGKYNQLGDAQGLLIHNPATNRLSLIFAKGKYEVEKMLFDRMFKDFSETSPTLIFESGYPTPWISEGFSDYAVRCGFAKHERGI